MTKPRKVNVEPLLFLMSFGFGLVSTIHTAFITFKHCLWLLDSSVQALPNPHDYCQRLGSSSSQNHDYNSSAFHIDSSNLASLFLEDGDSDLQFLNRVQAATARYMIYSQVVSTAPTVLVTIFIGAWSDAHGRKSPIVIALAGSAVAAQVAVATAGVDSIPVYVMLAPAFLTGFTGHMLVVHGCTYAMISDAAQSSAALTIRIAVASGVSSSGSLLAHLISAVLLQHWDDYTLIFLCGGICTCSAFFYAVFGLQETIQFSRRREREEGAGTAAHTGRLVDASETTGSDDASVNGIVRTSVRSATTDRLSASGTVGTSASVNGTRNGSASIFDPLEAHVGAAGAEVDLDSADGSAGPDSSAFINRQCNGELAKEENGCKSFLHVNRIKESLHILTKARPGRRRFYLLTTLVSFSILFSIQPSGVLNLFAKRPPLSFTNSQYSYLTSAGSAMMFAPAVSTWLLKTSDMCLIIVGVAVGVFKMALTAFSTEQWMLFTAVAVGGLSTLEFTGFRSFMTKLVEPTETGRLFATVGVIDHLAPLLSSAVFNNLYAVTLDWFPGFVFLLSAVLTFCIFLVMSYLYVDMKKHKDPRQGEECPSLINDLDTEALIHSEIDG